MKRYIIALIILSGLTHFAYFGYPDSVVFDEVHFGNFSSAYTSGNYFFDIHPPLGKLLISAAGSVGGYHANSTNYGQIGNTFGDSKYMWYRILPMLAGFALPLIIYFLCLGLGMSALMAFFAGLLIIFENSLLVQSRFILLDSMLLSFGFAALLFYAYSYKSKSKDNRKRVIFLCLSALFAALSFSVKWTGISFLGIIALVELYIYIISARKHHSIKPGLKRAWEFKVIFIVIGLVIYFIGFAAHFALLPKSGPGDAFMTQRFQKTLVGNPNENDVNLKPLNLVQKFLELNGEMYRANSTLDATHQYGSKWYMWPVMTRGIFYWESAVSTTTPGENKSMIYLLGNVAIYWLSSLSVLILLLYIGLQVCRRFVLDKKLSEFVSSKKLEILLLIAFFANWLPFIVISRVAFLYHYETALIFAVVILAFVIDKYSKGKTRSLLFYFITLVSVLLFVYFGPLTYGIPMNETDLLSRFWFSSWR